jgi:hypothetical protein
MHRASAFRLPFTFAVLLTAACRSASRVPAGSPVTTLDSLTLERGACYGTCGIYEFIADQTGRASVRRDSVESHVDIAREDVRGLLTTAARAGVLTLPPRIKDDSTLCPLEASDHSTVTLTAYVGTRVARVQHYTGCYASHDPRVARPLERLVIFERLIDSLVMKDRR